MDECPPADVAPRDAEPERGNLLPFTDLYQMRWAPVLQDIQMMLHDPPPGPFDHTTIRWCHTSRHHGPREMGHSPADIAYIPWNRIEDFREGEERRPDAECKFVRKRIWIQSSMKQPQPCSFVEKYRYQCEYGPRDDSKNVLTLHEGLVTEKPKLDKRGKRIPNGNGHKGPRISKKMKGLNHKKGCVCGFLLKRLWLLPHICQLVYTHKHHVDADGVLVHGRGQQGQTSAVSARLSAETIHWIDKNIREGLSVTQVMKKHKDRVLALIQNGGPINRDFFVSHQDIRNVARHHAKETYMKHSNDATSVRMWVEENKDDVFFYQDAGGDVHEELRGPNIPFTIGIQTVWQRDAMLRHGHGSGVSIDATFGTNAKKFPLYTLMVFDDWYNGIPVAYVITANCKQHNLQPWMQALNDHMRSFQPDWQPNAFIVDDARAEINSLREVWPHTKIFLCLWHVRRAWLKQACIKIKDAVLRARVLKGIGRIMYDTDCPSGTEMDNWAQSCLHELVQELPGAADFWTYFQREWGSNTLSWVVGNRNLQYAGQDTNAAIESYHANLKATLKQSKGRYHGRRVDWTIHELVGDVLNHYWYAALRKKHGFVTNKKEEQFVVCALLKARAIPDACVLLPSQPGGPAVVTSKTNPQKRYWVHNPGEQWAACDCPHGMKGDICKHQMKVLKMMHPDLAEGCITRYCGSLKGTAAGGLHNMLGADTPGYESGGDPRGSQSTAARSCPRPLPSSTEGLEDSIRRLSSSIIEDSRGNGILLQHLLAALLSVQGTMKNLKSDLDAGLLHPSQELPGFVANDDGMGMSLKRRRDFLDAC